jgi:glutathione S-transferase
MALDVSGLVADRDYRVVRLAYADRARWSESVPPDASLPFLRLADGRALVGALPVLQYFEETIAGANLLPSDPVERVHARNRALAATELFGALRAVFLTKTETEEQATTSALFALLSCCETGAWSSEPKLDWIMFAAAATVLGSQPQLMGNRAWATLPATRARVEALRCHPLAERTRAPDYEREFEAFFEAFGASRYERGHDSSPPVVQ